MMSNHFTARTDARIRIPLMDDACLTQLCASGLHSFRPEIRLSNLREEAILRSAAKKRARTTVHLKIVRYLAAFALLLALVSARAQTGITLAWDADTDSTIVGYRLYQGASSHSYSTVTELGNVTEATVTNLPIGSTNFFAVTAYGTNGVESDYSAELAYVAISQRPPPTLPTLQVSLMPSNVVLLTGTAQFGQNYEVQASQDLKTWTAIRTITPDSTGSFAFLDATASSYWSRAYRLRGIGP